MDSQLFSAKLNHLNKFVSIVVCLLFSATMPAKLWGKDHHAIAVMWNTQKIGITIFFMLANMSLIYYFVINPAVRGLTQKSTSTNVN